MTTKSQSDPENGVEKDPSQLIPPYVDTQLTIYKNYTLRDCLLFLPAFIVTGIGIITGIMGDSTTILILTFVVGAVLVFIPAAIKVMDRQYTSPLERVNNWTQYLKRHHRFPFSYDQAAEEAVHGVDQIHDGYVEMTTGRYVAMVRVHPTNTGLADRSELNELAAELSSAIDEEIRDFKFTLYSTTVDDPPKEVVSAYQDRANEGLELDAEQKTAAYRREHLRDVADWYEHKDIPTWGAKNWKHYVVVSVDESDVVASPPSTWEVLNPLTEPDFEIVDDEKVQALEDNVSAVLSGLRGITGVQADRVDPAEHVDLLLRFWTNRSIGAVTEDNPTIPDKFTSDGHPDDEHSPLQRQLTPSEFDPKRGMVQVGEEYCKTFWISEWPIEPESTFLRELYTYPHVDLDVNIHVQPEDKRERIAELEHEVADINAEGIERAEESDLSAMDVDRDEDAYIKYRNLLQETPTQPWKITGYVTVRADSEAAIEYAEESFEELDNMDLAKEAALENNSEEVWKTLESTPAKCTLVPPGTRQLEAFRSCAPGGRNEFDEVSKVDKSLSVPGGAIGAMFPFCATSVQEPNGMDWGRNEQNGELLRADPFDRGSAPHLITIGKSRSGKTYAATKAALRWYQQSDDHTLIVCDTQSGFEGITELVDGKHMIIDGRQTINPLDIQPVTESVRRTGEDKADPYRMKIDEAAGFVAGIIRAQGKDPSDLTSTIEEILEQTYANAGIYQGDHESHARESPTMEDFIETAKEMLESPEEYSLTGHDAEISTKVTKISDLIDHLSGFKDVGKYSHFLGETETGLTDPDVDMAYLDLRQVRDSSNAEKSVMLQLMLSQVSEKVKRTEGKLVFMIDEAHVLLHSDEMVRWLQKAAREWARYDAAMWFISQSPREFLQQSDSKEIGQENKRRTIADQCSTIQFFRTPRVETKTLREFGLNEAQITAVRKELVRGKAGKGYSECIMNFEDQQGWFRTFVEATDFEDLVLNYSAREHGEFDEYLQRRWPDIEGVRFEEQVTDRSDSQAGDTAEEDSNQSSGRDETEEPGKTPSAAAPRTIGSAEANDD